MKTIGNNSPFPNSSNVVSVNRLSTGYLCIPPKLTFGCVAFFLIAYLANSALAGLTNDERQAISSLQAMHKELSENELFGPNAYPYIEQVEKNLNRKTAGSPHVQLALAIVRIDRGINVKREALSVATRLKTNWTAWKTALVPELVFGDANEAVAILSKFQKAVLTAAKSAQADPALRQEACEQLLWIQDAGNQLAILPAASEVAVNRIIDSTEAKDLIATSIGKQQIDRADEARRDKDAEFFDRLKAATANKIAFMEGELEILQTEIPAEIMALSGEFKIKNTELQPLAAALSAARSVSSAADSAVSSINSRLSKARSKADDIDEDEEPGAKKAAEAAVEVLEGQLAAARADAEAARAEETRAESVYCLKLGEMQEIYATAANVVNFGKNRVLRLRREFEDILVGSIQLQEKFKKVELLIGTLLTEFPPMPTFVRRKSSREMELEETRRIVQKLRLSVDEVFSEITR
ncbi:MAG: hypothetical protein RLZZ436_3179 [Planctomycetota bacterium]|jgi:hypothetical protein